MNPLGLIGGIGGALGGGLGGGGGGPATATMGDFNFGGRSAKQAENKKLMLYIGGGVAALLVIVFAAWLFKRK
jgi:hypothetical protein